MAAITGNLTYVLLLTLALFAVLAACARRGVVSAGEVSLVGAALTFFGVSLVFNAALRRNIPIYGNDTARLLTVTALMVLPLALALVVGLFFLGRSLRETVLATFNINGLTLRLVRGSLARVQTPPLPDALVCFTTPRLRMNAGAAAALKAFGGADIEREAMTHAPLAVGQAIATGAGKLTASHIIHAVAFGPDGRTDEARTKQTVDAALRCAKKAGLRRIALPLPPGGVGGLRPDVAALLLVATAVRARKDFDAIILVALSSRDAAALAAQGRLLSQKYPATTDK